MPKSDLSFAFQPFSVFRSIRRASVISLRKKLICSEAPLTEVPFHFSKTQKTLKVTDT